MDIPDVYDRDIAPPECPDIGHWHPATHPHRDLAEVAAPVVEPVVEVAELVVELAGVAQVVVAFVGSRFFEDRRLVSRGLWDKRRRDR